MRRCGIRQAQEPAGIQALGPERPVERFDEGVVGGLPRPREVERDTVEPGPQIERLADELGPVVEADRLRRAVDPGDPLQRVDDVRAAVVRPHVERRREPAEGVDAECADRLGRLDSAGQKLDHREAVLGDH